MTRDRDRPFADLANRMAHMPWTLPGYRPIVPRQTIWQWFKEVMGLK